MPASRTQPCPRGTLIADQCRAGEARPRGKSEGLTGRSLLQTGQHKVFTCHGGRVARATPSLKPAAFPSTTQVLCFFLDSRKERTPSPPVLPPSFYLRGLAKYDIMLQGIPFRLFWGGFGAGRLRPAARSDRWITWWKVCGRAAKTPVTAGIFSPLLGESAFGDNVDNRFWGGQNRTFGGEAPHCH